MTNKPIIPTVSSNVSAFTNDANYQTNSQVSSAISTHNSSNSAHSDIRAEIANKQNTIFDLATIRSGAQAGSTAVQPSALATVATSGNYNDLSNKPTIPTVGNGIITITQGGISKGTFTTNQGGNTTIDLEAGGTSGADINLSNITTDGKEVIAHNAMPSDRYVNLTLGVTGSTYTAPADGWFFLNKSTTAVNQYASAHFSEYSVTMTQPKSGYSVRFLMPVSKGTTITIDYDAGGSTNTFRFIYVNGAQ